MNTNNNYISDERLIVYLTGEANPQLVQQVEKWLSESDENRIYFNELEKVWAETKNIQTKPLAVDVDAAWEKLSNRIHATKVEKDINKFSRQLLKIAAVLIITFGIWAIVANLNNNKSLISQNTTIEKVLSDGSDITLNKNSKLLYPNKFKKNTREVKLEGEAFFDIKHNDKQPFIIHAGDANVKVLGTSFNVKAYPNSKKIEVYVRSGIVKLYSENNTDITPLVLKAGEKGVFDEAANKTSKVKTTKPDELFWAEKTLIFKNTELLKVIEVLEKCYSVKITVQNQDVNICKLNVTFKNETIDYILKIIATSLDLEVTKKDNKTYTLNGEGC